MEEFCYESPVFAATLHGTAASNAILLRPWLKNRNIFVRFHMFPNTFWMILDDQYKISQA